MTKYQIQACYETGDSFRYYDTETVLELSWTNLDKAKAALKRIKEHYLWYADKHGWSPKKVAEPTWHCGMEYDFCIKLETDHGVEVQIGAPWCGYFETLQSAKVIVPLEENDMEIVI